MYELTVQRDGRINFPSSAHHGQQHEFDQVRASSKAAYRSS